MPFYIFCTIILNCEIIAQMTHMITFPLLGFLLSLNTHGEEWTLWTSTIQDTVAWLYQIFPGPGEKRDKPVWGRQRSHSNDPLWPVLLLHTYWQIRKLISRDPWGQLCIWTKFTAESPGAMTLCLPPMIPAGSRDRVLTTCSLPYLLRWTLSQVPAVSPVTIPCFSDV